MFFAQENSKRKTSFRGKLYVSPLYINYRIGHLIFLSVLKENGLHKGKWVEMGIILLFAVFFALHLALTARNLVPPSLPQPLLSTTISSQKDYALIAKHRSAILFYVVYLAVLTLLFSAFTSYAMLQQYLHKK